MVMNRLISQITPAQTLVADGDMLLKRAIPIAGMLDAVGPFVFFDHYRSSSARGIGDRPHPHAGIELISYLLDGEMEHRDSMGFHDRLGPEDAQWIRAGRGMIHAEQPLSGRHGVQVWAMLPKITRFAEPQYRSWRAAQLPLIQRAGATVRVLAGTVAGETGPIIFSLPALFAHLRLEPGAAIDISVDPEMQLGAYVLNGAVEDANSNPIKETEFAHLSAGNTLALENRSSTVSDVILLGGVPAERPILFSGPFVMSTPEEILKAKSDFASGEMGQLEGVPG